MIPGWHWTRRERQPRMLPDGVDPHGLRDTIIMIAVLMLIYVGLLWQ